MPTRERSSSSSTAATASGRSSTRGESSRFDTTTGTRGLTNARTRLVGERTGVLADLVVVTVRAATAVADAVAAVLRRVGSVVTPVGWGAILAVPFALGFGYGFGLTELVLVGWAVLAVLVIATAYLVGRSPVRIGLDVPHSRVVVGEPATGRVLVSNPVRRRTFGVTVEVPLGDGLAELALPGLVPGAEASREFTVPSDRRGVVPIGPVRTVRADPFGLVRRELVWADVAELVVHPRTIGVPSTSTGLVRDLEGNPTRDLVTNDVSFHALREYVPGDERRYIHWKSTARTGRYMVRQFEETRRSHLVIALSLAEADFAGEAEFELAVSVAGSLGVRAIRDARTVTVVASERTPEFAKRKVFAVRSLSTLSRSRLLDDLARVERAESALSITDVARVTGEQSAGVSVAFLVCGSTVEPTQLRAAASAFAAGVEVMAVVCDPDASPGLRRVAGLSVLTIGYLEDLQFALARAAAA